MSQPSADTESGTPKGPRVVSVDLLRGLVMVVMVLDHVRDFFGDGNVDPTDLSRTTPALFFTRWVTHFCAPIFMFLAGTSAYFSGARKTKGELSHHLLIRGLGLIVLEQTVVSVCVFFTYPHFVLALVFWAIGWSMIALAALIYLPKPLIAGFGLALIACHNGLDDDRIGESIPGPLWSILHVPGFQSIPPGIPILVGYPLIPWIGVMAVGYASGPIFRLPPGRRRAVLLALGLASVAGFVALRWSNRYGDPGPWSTQGNLTYTIMSFLNCRKYPPSLLYLLMTLGPALLTLAAFDRGMGQAGEPLRSLGQVPLFFYLIQWPLAHGLAVALAAYRGFPIGWMFRFPPFQSPPGYGQDLAMVYLFWAITVGLLYYPCYWYSRRARGRRRVAN